MHPLQMCNYYTILTKFLNTRKINFYLTLYNRQAYSLLCCTVPKKKAEISPKPALQELLRV